MTKEDFINRYCPDYEEVLDIYDYYHNFLDNLSIIEDNLPDDIEDLRTALEAELSYEILGTLCSLIYGNEVYYAFEDWFSEAFWDGENIANIEDRNTVYVNFDVAIAVIAEGAADNDIELPEIEEINKTKILHELNQSYSFKFV